MDRRLVATTVGAIFLAEPGDKTQLAALMISAGSTRPRFRIGTPRPQGGRITARAATS